MYKLDTIVNENNSIELVCLYDMEKCEYYMPYIEFKNLKDSKYPDQTLCWDNPDFIFGKFYRFLKRYQNKELKKKDPEKFDDIWEVINNEIVDELIDMLDKAISYGWYKKE